MYLYAESRSYSLLWECTWCTDSQKVEVVVLGTVVQVRE